MVAGCAASARRRDIPSSGDEAVDGGALDDVGGHDRDDDAVAVARGHRDRLASRDARRARDRRSASATVAQRAGRFPATERRERDRAAGAPRRRPSASSITSSSADVDRVEVAQGAEHHRDRVARFGGEHVGPADRLERVVGVGLRHERVAHALVEQLELVGFHYTGRFRRGVPAIRARLHCISIYTGRFRCGVPAIRPRLHCISIYASGPSSSRRRATMLRWISADPP